MKVLVTGAEGQLGFDVVRRLEALAQSDEDLEYIGVDIGEFDLTNYLATRGYLLECKPDAIVHCAAFTAVDRAEEERDICTQVNLKGTENVAKCCKEIDAKLIYISTDYVFGDEGDLPHQIEDEKTPVNFYGETKLQGEHIVQDLLTKYFIVRTSWVFGSHGNNFVKTMLRLAGEKKSISVVADQIGSPTYTVDLAVLLCDMLKTEKYGVYHATNEGTCSWYEFACEIFRMAKVKVAVIPVTSKQYSTKARRSKNSILSKTSLDSNGFERLPHWKTALEQFIASIEKWETE